MARITVVEVVDDLSGKVLSDPETVRFGIDGSEYQLETSQESADELRSMLQEYAKISRKRTTRRSDAARAAASVADIRAWAVENGWDISERGRVPKVIVDAYNEAH
ncbi:histone-like nucleoid-structuring protein Lsr2 [Williamsia serinedens]|uniref:Lsr2 protein n=1 Tax=Williamsia serinedens TaxID=391736 RepID=A0ABT1H3R2_9NOCA|nr:Lsr2 family protein [Williamsia serinedens]MBE7194993.1 Lsr2 family protein [Gordonia polyisoprenivorans]MCP2161886.1 Lsr2 protein [Williamsia serinedens]